MRVLGKKGVIFKGYLYYYGHWTDRDPALWLTTPAQEDLHFWKLAKYGLKYICSSKPQADMEKVLMIQFIKYLQYLGTRKVMKGTFLLEIFHTDFP